MILGLLTILKKYQASSKFEVVNSTWLSNCQRHVISPGGVRETSARAWCTGKTQRDQVEREVGGGDRDGEHM